MIGTFIIATMLAAATPTSPAPRPPCDPASSDNVTSCDTILRHSGPPERFTQTTEYECRGGFRFRLIHEAVNTRWMRQSFAISATTLRPEQISTVSAADIERMASRFEGATVASAGLDACGPFEGTVELLVTYSRIDWPQVRAVRFTVSADGQLDTGVVEQYN
ncbi:MAG: hypothetical protein ABL874_04820 [Sphingopyxis sp.]